MAKSHPLHSIFAVVLFFFTITVTTSVQAQADDEFGPVVRAYLGYLKNEQGVVDDRVSRHEVSRSYYRRNSARIQALRLMAVKIARETDNDYLPELEAVAGDELSLLFENPPRFSTLRIGEVLQTRFRYLGNVRAGETFYVFARLDPYEQSELMSRVNPSAENVSNRAVSMPLAAPKVATRARRVGEPR